MSAGRRMVGTSGSTKVTQESLIAKSAEDQRLYRGLQLDNGLKVTKIIFIVCAA